MQFCFMILERKTLLFSAAESKSQFCFYDLERKTRICFYDLEGERLLFFAAETKPQFCFMIYYSRKFLLTVQNITLVLPCVE
jgi:hypothetical protein